MLVTILLVAAMCRVQWRKSVRTPVKESSMKVTVRLTDLRRPCQCQAKALNLTTITTLQATRILADIRSVTITGVVEAIVPFFLAFLSQRLDQLRSDGLVIDFQLSISITVRVPPAIRASNLARIKVNKIPVDFQMHKCARKSSFR